mgnify:CR=1 FL=1|tara:strand:- start:1687 stop:2109 length:423 start_codon:yes stop_codon:yes gene_type:complete
MADYRNLRPGLHSVAAYQVSGEPFVTGNIDCKNGLGGEPYKIQFPSVTQWIMIINHGNSLACDVGFSARGLKDKNNYFKVPDKSGTDPALHQVGPLYLKVSELYLTGSDSVDVIAGLTSIPANQTDTDYGKSWSGSAGVR